MSHSTSLLTHTHTEFILNYFFVGRLTKDLGWRHHPNGNYIMAPRMPVQGSQVDTFDSLVALTPSTWYHTHYFSSKTGSTACFR